MMGYEITSLLTENRLTKESFRGVFPSNRLPKTISHGKAHGFVINLDPAHKSGSHWTALYISVNNDGFFFDSFGLPVFNKNIKLFINQHCRTIRCNESLLQHPTEVTCGLYCVYFLIRMCKGDTIPRFLALFKPHHPTYNDRKIKSIISMELMEQSNNLKM